MALEFEELRVLQAAEAVADDIWRQVVRWDSLAREVVGRQMARAADPIGANIAEAYGRYHFGEKLQFLYYARGSLFETKYWLSRARARELMPLGQVQGYASQLTALARQVNAFAGSIRAQRHTSRSQRKAIGEALVEYEVECSEDTPPLFTEGALLWLQTVPGI